MATIPARKCTICHTKVEDWYMWQPLGPSETHRNAFYNPGWHYRGFPVFVCCETCEKKIRDGEPIRFRSKNYAFDLIGDELRQPEIKQDVDRVGENGNITVDTNERKHTHGYSKCCTDR